MIERAGLQAGQRVLDVGCGTGIVTRLAAAQVGGTGRVAGLDVNAGMLEMARSLQQETGASIEWHHNDVVSMPFPDGAFDVVLSQLVVQFLPDRPPALREIHRVLVPGGRLAFSVYSPIERNPAARALADGLDRYLDPSASVAKRSEHALADPASVRNLVAGAGFRDVEIHTVTKVVRFLSPREWLRIQLAATPLAAVVGRLEADRRTALVEGLNRDVGQALEAYMDDQGLAFPQECLVMLARS
jgi:ubiquinone/menaquinone biosynthesis C-methylase UbiE